MGTYTLLTILVGIWIALNAKTTRSDGVFLRRIHSYRTMMGYIMPTRNESVVYFDIYVDAEQLLDYIEQASKKFPVDITHCLVATGAIILCEVPQVNRFSLGRRLYQRKHNYVSFSMKRKQLDKDAKLSNVKLRIDPEENFKTLCERINKKIDVERSGIKTYEDKEYGFFSKIPRPILRFAIRAVKTLDYYGLLPASFIENDPLYTSMFLANLGSLNMAPGYHHLYEWGNSPLFMMIGKVEDRATVVDGKVVVRKQLHARWTYDERIDDGLNARFGTEVFKRVLENPFENLGCLSDDGSDTRPFGTGKPSDA